MTDTVGLRTSFRARLRNLHIASFGSHASVHTGARRSRQTGSSIEFSDFRRYSPGDDVRQIDWNVYARSDRLFIKLREAEDALNVHILVDCSASMDRGAANKLGYARTLAGALAYVALNDGDAITLSGFAERLRNSMAGVGAGQVDRALDLLAGLGALAEMGHEIVLLHVLDREEDIAPDVGEDVELVDCETADRLVIPGDADAAGMYERNFHAWLEEIRGACARSRIRYVALETDWPVEEVVVQRLRMLKVVE